MTDYSEHLDKLQKAVKALPEQILLGRYAESLKQRIAELEVERDHWKELEREAAEYVEMEIVTRTHFTGEPPYVGWKGLGQALSEALDERDGWQPINTAPKEGINWIILGYFPDYMDGKQLSGKPSIAYWNGSAFVNNCGIKLRLDGGAFSPTHWMPLPAAPKPAKRVEFSLKKQKKK